MMSGMRVSRHRAVVWASGLATLLGAIGSLQADTPADAGGKRLMQDREQINQRVSADLDELLAFYKNIHRHPELSYQEQHTSQLLADGLRKAGFEVTEHVGGYGVVGVLRNGQGPTVLVRTDMDALPVNEKTGLPYASTVQARDPNGNTVPVMHACGHDMHMTCWLETARVLAGMKDRWSGTLVFIGQPAEERGGGARAMLEDGLYQRFPKPDFALALHCHAQTAHGEVVYAEGQAMANVDSVNITVRGRGGHGSAPHTTVDPIVLAARIILDLQTLVSRENNPIDPAVVTVGSIHGGTKHNIIPDEVKLQLTVRTMKESVRKHILEGIERIVKADAMGARAPEPTVSVDAGEFTPSLTNDEKLTRRTVAALKEVLGPDHVKSWPPTMGGEDFSRYAREGTPIFMFGLGTIPPERAAEARREGGPILPSLHSDKYYPVPEPTIKTGVLAMCTAVLNLMGK